MKRRHLRRAGRLALIALGITLALGGLAVAWGQGDALPPRVYDTVPLEGEELALDGSVTFYFDQPMDTAAVIDALEISPTIRGGGYAWSDDDRALTVSPGADLARATEYTFTIGTGARSAAGAAMEEAFTLKLRTVGYLEVSEVLPADGTTAVDTDSVVTVIFNRPVVPLLTVEDMAGLPQPLVFDPPVEGTGEWLNTSIYLFTPATELKGGTDYAVTVQAGLEDVTGGVLDQDYTWSFRTIQPDVVDITPRDGFDRALLEQTVTVTFSQAMDPDAVKDAFALLHLGPIGADQYFPEPVPVPGTFEWTDDFRTLTFTPDAKLELESAYRITIDAARALSATGAALREGVTAQFYTLPYPRIVNTSPHDGETNAWPYGGFTINFNTLMDLDSLEGKVIVDPTPWREDYDTYFYDWGYSYTLAFDTEPSTEYTITILPGMMDRYGNTITEGLVVNYTTAPYDPELTIQATGQVGLYNAYNPSTRVFLTHRNVSRIDLGLWRVSLPRFAALTGPDSWDEWDSFTPAASDLLRRWSIDVSSEQDVRRYELLYISDKGPSGIANIDCLGAPDPQVKVGDVAIVTREDQRPLNVRAEPNLGATVITQALPDETMQVTGGPYCEGGYLWWQVRLDNGITGWAAEGDQTVYYFEPLGAVPPDPNAPESQGYGQPYAPESLAPGLYYLEVSSQETQNYDYYSRRHLMVVATANITLKYSQDTALAWVTDLQSGAPVAGVPVIFYNNEFNPVGQVTTDADGLAVLAIPHLDELYQTMYATVDASGAFGVTVSRWTDGMDPWQFDIAADWDPEDRTVYLYTDRPIYRPDQPVYFKGIIRDRRDVTYTVPDLKEVPVKIYDDRGEVVYDKTLPVTPQGSFSGELLLDAEAPLGYYRIVAEVRSNNSESFGLSFSVAEYRAPEFQVQVTPQVDAVVQGDTIQVAVESSFFFGGAVSNARVSWSALSRDYYFNYTGDQPGYWSFTDENYDFYAPEYYGPYGEVVAEGEGTTDAQGRFIIEIPADLGEKSKSQTYTIEARVTDESDQLVAGRTTVTVHQGLVYVGVQPTDYIGRAERENTVNILVVDWDSQPVGGQEVEYQVVERRWFSVQEEDPMGRTTWTWDVKEEPVEGGSGTVVTDARGLAQVRFTPPAGGVYKIYATTTDTRGNTVRSSAFMWVSGKDFVNWRQENSNRIQLITDKDEYRVGDTAQILIPSPFQGAAYALITVERGDILSQQVVLMETNSTIFELPILPEHAPNVFVSVVLVKGVDENNPVAAFRMGVTQLNVDTSRLVMDLEVTPSIDVAAGEFAGPGDTVEYVLTATDWQGNPVPNAEIGVGLTDLSVLTIADPNSPELLPFFYYERGITVVTSSPLTKNVDQATQTIIDTIKGGGGGYGEGGIFEVRQEFVDTPLWVPSVITDANGQATVSVTLPDNLTTWRLDARAVTTGADGPMLVGQTTFDLLSTKPVLIRPTTGRFFVVGDKATLAAVVNNNTNQDLLTEVTLEGTGFVFAGDTPASQWVNIPAKGRARVNWPVEIQDVPFVDVTFYANAGDGLYTDASKPPLGLGDDRTLPVYKYEAPETVGTAGTLSGPDAGSRTEAIVLPRRYEVTQGELTVRIDRSLAAAAVDGMNWLQNYPYFCIEQIISRFLPNAVTLRALHDLGLDDPVLQANLEVQVGYALQRLYAQQKADGGWGWFPQDESNPIVTAYALIGLAEAQKSGFTIEQSVINRATDFVQSSLRTIRPQDSRWIINRQAFLLYALARADRGNVAATVRLFDERESMSLYAKAYLAMTFHLLDPKDRRAVEMINDLNNALVVSATGGHWEEDYQDWWNWNTDTRTTALGLLAMAQIDPQNELIPNVVRWLMVARTADAWETTQETAWAVMALTEWMVVTGELYPDYTFNVSLNDERMALEDNTATPDNVRETEVLRIQVADLLADLNRLTFSRSAGDGNMYYTAHLRAYLPVPEIEPLNRGLILSRKYSLLDDPEGTPITSAEVGQPVQVTLTIIAPSNLHYVVVEDPIPAGADAINPNLNTASVVGTQPQLNRERPLSRGWGWWWFSNVEMRDEKVVLYATYLPRGTYQFEYVIYPGLAGEYNVIPTTGQEFYFPEVYGRADGMLFTITGGAASETVAPPAEPLAIEPTEAPTAEPTAEPTIVPTEAPTAEPTAEPTMVPTEAPTAEPTVEPTAAAAVELPPLTETYTTPGGLSFMYPAGWAVIEDNSFITLATTQEAAESQRITPGVVGINLVDPPTTRQEFGAGSVTETLQAFIGQTLEDPDITIGEIAEFTLNDRPAARVNVRNASSEFHVDGVALAMDLGGGDIALLLGAADIGEFEQFEPLILDIAASVRYVAPPVEPTPEPTAAPVLPTATAMVMTEAPAEPTGEPTAEPTEAPTEEAAIGADFGVVTIGVNAEYPPFESVDENGQIVGFDIELMNAIAARAGFEIEWINTRWDGIFVALASGEFDAVASAATITPEREEIVDFSDPYFNAGQMIAVREQDAASIQTPDDLAGLRVGVQSGTTGDIAASEIEGVEVVRYDEITLAFQALAAGDVDAVVNDGPVSAAIIASNPELGVVLVGDPFTDELYGIAVQPDRPDLLNAINAALADLIADGTYNDIYMDWFGMEAPSMFQPAGAVNSG